MSFHAYLKMNKTQKRANTDNPSMVPLEELNCTIKQGCTEHPPWPRGICTKCQPSAITLNHQKFRMVDHVEFESPAIVEEFLQFWRKSGYQRFGYLYGRYEPYLEVPLGIKAVVSAIYEPPQERHEEGVALISPDPDEERVEAISDLLGLRRVGMIYTDLQDDGMGRGKVAHKRGADTYFLSCAELLFSAFMQHHYPSPCKYSSSGKFCSKFITIVVSGDERGDVSLEAYQVSNQCVAMANAGIIEASVDPALMRVKPSTSEQYVPEVFFKSKNEYNVEVTHAADPVFPVDYLLVSLTHGFPVNPQPLFSSPNPFPIENRQDLDRQDIQALKRRLASSPLLDFLRDFHLLVYLHSLELFDWEKDFKEVCQTVREHDTHRLEQQVLPTKSWATLQTILRETPDEMTSIGLPETDSWSCSACSFANPIMATRCQMCDTPRVIDGFTPSHRQLTEWPCPRCTYLNPPSSSFCEICGASPS
jgi:nuclear protein localization protein 4 homolog